MATTKKGITIPCLDCERPIRLDFRPGVGHVITCTTCEAVLEVTRAQSLKLDFCFEEWEADEDWDENEDQVRAISRFEYPRQNSVQSDSR